ncbi:Rec114p Ecym_6065 [Eremothecium cymbalariae DBVPG|uniref:Uncharacterized protein n=1 Tax=Eremothecium cymbalariae (strain CBS 270.75 / DBVPG 7215 / KCTC 17166 / NRRL Y-17582) TaxID=931890 RepID=G8JUY6_ERECY|nr:hypothetical protein Ecym_6065 [Eremothecium cymbalariae DBVPG\
MNEFVIPIRKYSQYSFWEPAPQGFNSPKAPIMVEKWKHFPMRDNLVFKIANKSNGLLSITVNWNNLQVLEEVTTPLKGDVVQFSFKAPSISCKYLYIEGSQTFIRRFQIGFITGNEFLQTKEVLSKLGFVMRNAMSTRQNTAAIKTPVMFGGSSTQNNRAFDFSCANQSAPYSQLETLNWTAQCSQNLGWNLADPLILSQSTPLPTNKSHILNINCMESTTHSTDREDNFSSLNNGLHKETNPSTITLSNTKSIEDIDEEFITQMLQDKEFMRWVCVLKLKL